MMRSGSEPAGGHGPAPGVLPVAAQDDHLAGTALLFPVCRP